MASPASPCVDWDLPAVPGADFEPRWDKELTGARADLLREFAEWVRTEDLPETPDPDLVKFVHSCDYDLEKAKKCAKDFYWSRNAIPELFSGWDPTLPNLKIVLDTVIYAIMPKRTPDNFRVIYASLQTSDTTNYVIADLCKVSFEADNAADKTVYGYADGGGEHLLDGASVSGIIIIQDCEKLTLSHIIKTVWWTPRKIQVYFEDGVPLKRDKMHLIHCPGMVDKGLKLIGRIMRKEDQERMKPHCGKDHTELYKYVPTSCLPNDIGGNLPPLMELHEMTIQRLKDFKEVFERFSPGVTTSEASE